MKKKRVPPTPRLALTAAVKMKAAAKSAALSIVAYTGGELFIDGFAHPVIVDYDGLEFAQQLPILDGHQSGNLSAVLGQSDRITIEEGQLIVQGKILAKTASAVHVRELAAQGYEWQASIGSLVLEQEGIPPGETVEVNGRTFTGPVIVARHTVLREVSFVPVGGDLDTSVAIAARAARQAKGSAAMPTFEEWAESKGIDLASLTEDEIAALQEEYDAEMAAGEETEVTAEGETEGGETDAETSAEEGPDDFETWVQSLGFVLEDLNDQQRAALSMQFKALQDEPVEASASYQIRARQRRRAAARANASAATKSKSGNPVATMRLEAAAETRRIATINRTCKKFPSIAAAAIAAGWSPEKAELAMLKAQKRSKAPAGHVRQTETSPQVMQAAICLQGKMTNIEKHFPEKILDAASRQYRGGIGLQRVLLEAAWEGGCHERFLSADTLRPILKAAFSTSSLPGILSNTANKFMLQGYENVDQSWKEIAAIASAKDFKTTTRYRMLDGGDFEEIGPSGELKHGKLSEQEYTNRVKTHGRMYSITREMIINDDLGALSDVPRLIGRRGALKLCKVFWTKFLSNQYQNGAAVFSTDNKNYFSGGTSNLSSTSLETAVQKFLDQTEPGGDPLAIEPKFLLVPTALKVTADELYVSTNINTGGSSTKDKVPNTNVHAGKYKPIVSPYLSNANFPGYSSKAWHLLADPADVALMEVIFLNGVQQPIVENSDADFDHLGIQMRGYFDFGVEFQDHRGGVKSKGEA